MKKIKPKEVKLSEIEETYYLAYYKKKSEPIAISTSRELVKEYMEIHRMVKQRDYEISSTDLRSSEVFSLYPNSLIEQYETWYLPSIDIEMINVNKVELDESVNHTIEGLKDIVLLIQDIKKIPTSDKEIILKSMHIINGFRQKKKIWNKIVDNYKLSDLIFMDMDTYLSKRFMYIELKESRQRWGFLIEQKGGDVNKGKE